MPKRKATEMVAAEARAAVKAMKRLKKRYEELEQQVEDLRANRNVHAVRMYGTSNMMYSQSWDLVREFAAVMKEGKDEMPVDLINKALAGGAWAREIGNGVEKKLDNEFIIADVDMRTLIYRVMIKKKNTQKKMNEEMRALGELPLPVEPPKFTGRVEDEGETEALMAGLQKPKARSKKRRIVSEDSDDEE